MLRKLYHACGRTLLRGKYVALDFRLRLLKVLPWPFSDEFGVRTYLNMQRRSYRRFAAKNESTRLGDLGADEVVGSWRFHNEWRDHERLFDVLREGVPNSLGLEYGCGPGRNLALYGGRYERLDGVDVSQEVLDQGKVYLGLGTGDDSHHLFLTRGDSCGSAPSATYGHIFSVICLQHICVWEVRQRIFRDIYRCLASGGALSFQMGFGTPSPQTVPYGRNFFLAPSTNRGCDVAVANPEQIRRDLDQIGFVDFKFEVTETGPGDTHPKWIYCSARKPSEVHSSA